MSPSLTTSLLHSLFFFTSSLDVFMIPVNPLSFLDLPS